MEFMFSIGGILGVLLIGVISPGPSFLLVAQTSISTSRGNGVAAAIGMGVGAVSFAALVLGGLHAVLTNVPILYVVLKICGGMYLLYLAVRIWKGAAEPLLLVATIDRPNSSWQKSFLLALGTMLSNLKAVVQYGTIFAALLPRDVSMAQSTVLAASIFLLEAGWYIIVALLLSSTAPRNAYLKSKTSIDRTASVVMGLLGLKLIASLRSAI